MNKWLPHPILTPALTIIWLLLNNSLTFGTLLLGLLLAWAIPALTLKFWPERVRIHRPRALLRFAAVVLVDILIANFRVAWLILAGPRALKPLFVIVPLTIEDDLALSMLANTICLTPGTVSARLSADRRSLLVHALAATDPGQLVMTIKERYEAPLVEAFSC